MLKTAKATAAQKCATCYEEWQAATANAAVTLQAVADCDDDSECEADAQAQRDVELKFDDLQVSRAALDAASTALDDEYIKRQPDGKAALAIVKKRKAALGQEVKRCQGVHISCQKAIERAMQAKKPYTPERFASLRESETAASDALSKATQALAQAS